MDERIVNWTKRLESGKKKLADSELRDEDKQLILKFCQEKLASGMSKSRIGKYLYTLMRISTWLSCSFQEATKDDLVRVMAKVESADYTAWTKHDYKAVTKYFWRWMNDGEFPDEVKWINTTIRRCDRKLPEDIPSEDDVKKMIDAASKPRNRALVATLYESGGRIGEVLTRKLKHLEFDKYGARLLLDGKTGARKVRLVTSVPFLQLWINEHPAKNNPDAPLWYSKKTNV